jgi:hypothetical protein
VTDPDSRNRIIVVDGLFRSTMLEVMDRLLRDEVPRNELARLQLKREHLILDVSPYKEERREKVRDWQDREKRLTRPRKPKGKKRR